MQEIAADVTFWLLMAVLAFGAWHFLLRYIAGFIVLYLFIKKDLRNMMMTLLSSREQLSYASEDGRFDFVTLNTSNDKVIFSLYKGSFVSFQILAYDGTPRCEAVMRGHFSKIEGHFLDRVLNKLLLEQKQK